MTGDGRLWVWTDGSFMDHSKHGGWAWATREGQENSGSIEKGVSSEFMELLAIMEAVESLEGSLLVFCDHAGLVRNLSRTGWDRKAWLTGRNRKPNMAPFLRACVDIMDGRDIDFRWTKGHSTDPMNRQVDRMAGRARVTFEKTCPSCQRESKAKEHYRELSNVFKKMDHFGEDHFEAMLSARAWRKKH